MADAQTMMDAAALRAAAVDLNVTGSRLSEACAQIIIEEKAEDDRIASERFRLALEAETKKKSNLYDDLKNGIIR